MRSRTINRNLNQEYTYKGQQKKNRQRQTKQIRLKPKKST